MPLICGINSTFSKLSYGSYCCSWKEGERLFIGSRRTGRPARSGGFQEATHSSFASDGNTSKSLNLSEPTYNFSQMSVIIFAARVFYKMKKRMLERQTAQNQSRCSVNVEHARTHIQTANNTLRLKHACGAGEK